jgi:hypothetical protein
MWETPDVSEMEFIAPPAAAGKSPEAIRAAQRLTIAVIADWEFGNVAELMEVNTMLVHATHAALSLAHSHDHCPIVTGARARDG